ncbi:hypothetical protein P4S72_14630 [Vibrio sp. PP-XX7]
MERVWYGIQHVGEFWGNAALVSGFLLMFNSLPPGYNLNVGQPWSNVHPMVAGTVSCDAKVVSVTPLVALAGCAVLYIHTLVLLNM